MIREMKACDWERVAEIYTAALDNAGATFTSECPTYEEWNTAHTKECRFVYEKDGKVIGWVALSPTSAREIYRGVVEVSVYVDGAHHGEGVGTALLQTVCEESEKAGFWCIYTSIFPENTGSIAIHKKCGFCEIGYREKIAKDKFGVWRDTYLMERRSKVIV